MYRSFLLYLLYACHLVTIAAATWSGALAFGEAGPVIQKREDGSTTETSVTSTTPTQTGTTSSSSDASASTTGAQVTTGTGTTTSDSSTITSAATTTTGVNDAWAPGGIEMISPASGSSVYFKVGDYVTLQWNYTSLYVTPTAIDVMASCNENDHLYTIALNQSVDATGAVTWDTGEYQKTATVPLLTETYTLVVYDAANSISASASAGYLGTSDQYTFGMYLPQSYTPLNEIKCVTCANGAFSAMERQALGFVFLMATITLLSFTWFVGGPGAFF